MDPSLLTTLLKGEMSEDILYFAPPLDESTNIAYHEHLLVYARYMKRDSVRNSSPLNRKAILHTEMYSDTAMQSFCIDKFFSGQN